MWDLSSPAAPVSHLIHIHLFPTNLISPHHHPDARLSSAGSLWFLSSPMSLCAQSKLLSWCSLSASAWLGAYEHPVVDKINQKIEDITGLDVSTAEDLQVANYGVGGQYEPHFDFGRKDEPDAFEELGTGNRIATWLLYMSDVQAGGATVFTDISAAVQPKKGSAVFWFNLYPSGEGDYRTRHAACPVLLGNKWVSNKWIHERGQEFRRRCGLRWTD
ncbi:Prolyl 4-hydroxylase subunit alpha-1 [Crenichthys baileyi]|uniref:Prolyl 4-hydroxylase subunit alpha-1 n=1 Tax=Crenichthys baileyi TaxID=28760 RepID=A0AAV9RTV3_9TELE